LSVTIAAQIATAPLLLYYYGYLSGWTLLLNCVFVPIFTCAFSLFLLSAALAAILPFFAQGILYVSNVVWTLLLLVFQTADFTNFAISGLRMNVFVIIPYYVSCLFITDKLNLSKSWKVPLFFVGVLAFVLGMVALNL
jgi:predicted membrane metal-binding protein